MYITCKSTHFQSENTSVKDLDFFNNDCLELDHVDENVQETPMFKKLRISRQFTRGCLTQGHSLVL